VLTQLSQLADNGIAPGVLSFIDAAPLLKEYVCPSSFSSSPSSQDPDALLAAYEASLAASSPNTPILSFIRSNKLCNLRAFPAGPRCPGGCL
jgi:hypothetical protein